MQRRASFDRQRRYRYSLIRRWEAQGPGFVFVMLNPSRADARVEDPTIRRCLGFARRDDAASLEVVNLFAYRTPYPRVLARASDPVGPRNDRALRRALARADRIVLAWGNGLTDPEGAKRQADRVRAFLRMAGRRPLWCLGSTTQGAPRHPLRLAGSTPLVPWVPPQ